MRTLRRLVPIPCLVAALAAPVAAQTPAAEFLERVEVRVAEIDVVVLDGDGNPVRGLGRADFELLEDGKPVEISNFLAYDEESTVTVETGGEAPPAAAEAPVAVAPPPANWVVYLDQDRLEPAARAEVLRQFAKFLGAGLNAGDRVLVATFDGASLKVVVPLTTDLGQVAAALEGLQKKRGFVSQLESQRSFLRRRILAVNPADRGADVEAEALLEEIGQISDEEAMAGRLGVQALRDLLSLSAGLEGRVAILLAGAGFESRPGETLYRLWQQKFGNQMGRGRTDRELDERAVDLRREYGRLLAAINGGRFTFFTVQAGGGRGPDVSAETPNEIGVLAPGGDDTSGLRLGSSLAALASETGGRTFVAAPDLPKRMEVVRRDLASYYSLGYHPEGDQPGRRRRIEVKVRRPGTRVLARTQVSDPEAGDRLSDTAVAALLGSEGAPNPLGVSLEVLAPPAPAKRGSVLVPVIVHVPLANVTLLPDGAQHKGHLVFQFAIQDPDGGFRRLESRPLDFDVPNDKLVQAISQSVSFRVEMAFAPGTYRVSASVLDQLAGTLSSATGPVVVAAR